MKKEKRKALTETKDSSEEAAKAKALELKQTEERRQMYQLLLEGRADPTSDKDHGKRNPQKIDERGKEKTRNDCEKLQTDHDTAKRRTKEKSKDDVAKAENESERMEKGKSEKKERSKSRERSHSKSPRAKVKGGEANSEKQQTDFRKDGKRTRGEQRKLHYRRVPSPIHAPSDDETPDEYLKRKNKFSNKLTVESASEKKRRGRPPKSKKDEFTTKFEARQKGGRNSKEKVKDISTIKVMSEKFDKGNLPPERQKSLADELLGSVSEDSTSDDEPLISKRVKSPIHSPEDSPRARLISSPVPKTKRPRTVNASDKSKNDQNKRESGDSSRNKAKKSLRSGQKGFTSNPCSRFYWKRGTHRVPSPKDLQGKRGTKWPSGGT